MNFKIGDKVSWMGLEGTVERLNDRATWNPSYSMRISFGDKEYPELVWFMPDGRFREEHTEPSLKLIERPKKKVKKKISVWVNVYSDGSFTTHNTKHEADSSPLQRYYVTGDQGSLYCPPRKVACVECVGEYEVEE